MNNFLLKSLIPISTIHNEKLINITHVSNIEQDPTVEKGENCQ
jgi:hypothetical protein